MKFFCHDLTSGTLPAEQAYDLVLCRNVLIYLGRLAQQQVTETLLASLSREGFLCLGEAEWPPTLVAASLEPVDKRCRIFRATTMSTDPLR